MQENSLFTHKFILGVVLIILNFIIGKIATFAIIMDYSLGKSLMTWVIVYIISWIMLFIGIWLCGIEGYHWSKKLYRKYTSYGTYKPHIKRGIKKGEKAIKKSRKAIRKGQKTVKKVAKKVHKRIAMTSPRIKTKYGIK